MGTEGALSSSTPDLGWDWPLSSELRTAHGLWAHITPHTGLMESPSRLVLWDSS